MGNALVAALLTMAGEHRLKAESARAMIDPYPERTPGSLGDAWIARCQGLNQQLENEAAEQEGLAEVYERFAHRIIADVSSQLILEQVEQMFGPAELHLGPESMAKWGKFLQTEPLNDFRFLTGWPGPGWEIPGPGQISGV